MKIMLSRLLVRWPHPEPHDPGPPDLTTKGQAKNPLIVSLQWGRQHVALVCRIIKFTIDLLDSIEHL